MAFSTNESNGMYMPVAPAYGGGNGFGFGGDFGAWIILFLIFGMFGNGFGGFGNGGMNYDFPWLLDSNSKTDALVTNGFNNAGIQATLSGIQSSITSGFGDTALGIAGINQAICQTGNGITAAVTGVQNALAQQMYANQIADLNRSFDAQTASTAGMNAIQGQLAQCCCDNRLATVQTQNVIQTESAATRAANSQNTQAILDKLCQLELDNVKSQVLAEQRENANLRTELMYARGQASQIEQTAQILQGQNQEVDALYNRLNNCPVSTVPVYGKQPIFQCGGNTGCGCGM